MVELGDKVKDGITGFAGVVIGEAKYLNGCISYQVQSTKDISKCEWLDEQRLTVVCKATAGGPQNRPPELHP